MRYWHLLYMSPRSVLMGHAVINLPRESKFDESWRQYNTSFFRFAIAVTNREVQKDMCNWLHKYRIGHDSLKVGLKHVVLCFLFYLFRFTLPIRISGTQENSWNRRGGVVQISECCLTAPPTVKR